MPKYALMLRDNGFPPDLSPTELQAALVRYKTWLEKVGRAGGEKLKDRKGRVMKRGSVTDGPYVESKEVTPRQGAAARRGVARPAAHSGKRIRSRAGRG